MTERQDIATALSTIDGITGLAKRPTVYTSGLAWPQVASHDRDDRTFFYTTWSIYVIGPSDIGAIDDWYDDNIQAVHDALRPLVYIDRDALVAVPTGNATVYAILITARSE